MSYPDAIISDIIKYPEIVMVRTVYCYLQLCKKKRKQKKKKHSYNTQSTINSKCLGLILFEEGCSKDANQLN